MFVKANQTGNLFTGEQAVCNCYTGDPTKKYIQCTLVHGFLSARCFNICRVKTDTSLPAGIKQHSLNWGFFLHEHQYLWTWIGWKKSAENQSCKYVCEMQIDFCKNTHKSSRPGFNICFEKRKPK